MLLAAGKTVYTTYLVAKGSDGWIRIEMLRLEVKGERGEFNMLELEIHVDISSFNIGHMHRSLNELNEFSSGSHWLS